MPAKKYFYRVVNGSYSPAGKRTVTYRQGQVFESDSPNLCSVFRNKFEMVDGPDPAAPAPPKEVVITDEAEHEAAAKKKAAAQDDGLAAQTPTPPVAQAAPPKVEESPSEEDVTKDFEGAEEAGVKVVRIGKKYNVSDNGAILNSEPLSKKEVGEFIADYTT